MGFVRAASAAELQSLGMMGVEVGGKEIVLARVNGEYYAVGNRCTHMGCMLADGSLDGSRVTCPCHGSVFDVRTGAIVKGPAKKPEPVYQTKTEGDDVQVNI